jgi:hypothetical protein
MGVEGGEFSFIVSGLSRYRFYINRYPWDIMDSVSNKQMHNDSWGDYLT